MFGLRPQRVVSTDLLPVAAPTDDRAGPFVGADATGESVVRLLSADDRGGLGETSDLTTADLRPALARRRHHHATGRRTLVDLGLPDHLSPPDGGLFPLVALLESLPPARIPAMGAGDRVAVVTLGDAARRDDPAARTSETLDEDGHAIGDDDILVFAWIEETERRRARSNMMELTTTIEDLRPQLVLLRTTPDCTPTLAYTACRALPNAQLDLCGVQTSHRPAAPLGWGAPIAFVDGRRAWPALLAAVLADHLAGGVA